MLCLRESGKSLINITSRPLLYHRRHFRSRSSRAGSHLGLFKILGGLAARMDSQRVAWLLLSWLSADRRRAFILVRQAQRWLDEAHLARTLACSRDVRRSWGYLLLFTTLELTVPRIWMTPVPLLAPSYFHLSASLQEGFWILLADLVPHVHRSDFPALLQAPEAADSDDSDGELP